MSGQNEQDAGVYGIAFLAFPDRLMTVEVISDNLLASAYAMARMIHGLVSARGLPRWILTVAISPTDRLSEYMYMDFEKKYVTASREELIPFAQHMMATIRFTGGEAD